jgi:hypothetical protein
LDRFPVGHHRVVSLASSAVVDSFGQSICPGQTACSSLRVTWEWEHFNVPGWYGAHSSGTREMESGDVFLGPAEVSTIGSKDF